MGNSMAANEFYWSYSDEPHATRRKQILAKYPQVKELYGYDPKTKFIVLGWVLSQFIIAYLLRNSSWWIVVPIAWSYGGVASHALFLAMHEISHNLAFQKVLPNKLLGCFANTATVIPHFSLFQRYHMEHHQYQGVDTIDADIPSYWEGRLFRHPIMKIVWLFFQPAFYVTRPLFLKPKTPGFWEMINWGSCFVVSSIIYNTIGGKAVAYLAMSGFLGGGLHPIAAHFIAEHYVFVKGQETYSYYGPLNLLTFNVGYHNEHHDFPRIPGYRLPELKKIAAEFYDMPHYDSWVKVSWDYVMDNTVSPFSRIVRKDTRKGKDLQDKDD